MLPTVPSGEDWEGSGLCHQDMAEGQSRFGEHGASRMATITTVTPPLGHEGSRDGEQQTKGNPGPGEGRLQ